MEKITLNQLRGVVGNGFFSVNGYKKSNGEVSNFNAQMGVHVRTKGGTWNGNEAKHILMHKPNHYRRDQAKKEMYNGYRTLLKSSLIGCIIKANGKQYEIVG